tara:strand:+ start:2343 stop:2582 length:240 start_codon:yes stop_codon:yes gene_type:complete
MQLNEEIWDAINSTPSIPAESKKNLHVRIMRLVEQSQASPVGKKLGVTVMTQEGSLAGDKQASNRDAPPLAGDAKPKSL